MLGLREQVGGDERNVGRLIRNHHDLAGARQGIDADDSENLALGLAHVRVARAENLVDRLQGRRAEGHRPDRLHATDAINFLDAKQVQGREQPVGNLARGVRRGENRDLGTARDLCQRRRHQHGRNQRHFAPGHVDSHPPDRIEFLPDRRAVLVPRVPGLGQPAAVERDDILPRRRQRAGVRGGQSFRGGGELGGRHAEIPGAEFRAVELRGIVSHGFVAALPDVGQDGGDGIRDFLRHDGPAAERSQLIGKGFGGVVKSAHTAGSSGGL